MMRGMLRDAMQGKSSVGVYGAEASGPGVLAAVAAGSADAGAGAEVWAAAGCMHMLCI